jgi:hypothetical protein
VPWVQDPPETTGAGATGADAEEGAWEGCESPPSLELEPPPLELELPLEGGWLTALDEEVVCPWKDRAATTEIIPERATAPAIIQRLIRPIRARPASRVVAALLVMPRR